MADKLLIDKRVSFDTEINLRNLNEWGQVILNNYYINIKRVACESSGIILEVKIPTTLTLREFMLIFGPHMNAHSRITHNDCIDYVGEIGNYNG